MVLALTAYFTRNEWIPIIVPPTSTPVPTSTPKPTNTLTQTSTVTSSPTTTQSPTLTPSPTMTVTNTPILGTGDVQITLLWDGFNDLDLIVLDPFGEEIYHNNRSSTSGGQLDVDSNRVCEQNVTSNPVENIFWPIGDAPTGSYQISVNYYERCTGSDLVTPFYVRLLVDGQIFEYEGEVSIVDEIVVVTSFER